MFASLSSFLPSTAREKHPPPPPPPKEDQPSTPQPSSSSSPAAATQAMAADDPAKKRKDRTHESFIVVRPPPSKSNHPLNLQVQLVPPTGRQPTIVRRSQSIDSEADTSLSRTTSRRSEVSAYSSVTSLATVSSTGTSAASSSSTRRMIIPLYNLQAHNVMTNVIVDAGTDAKIARFVKRGLEVLGLALLEPVEIVGGARYDALAPAPYANGALLAADLPRTPTSSHLSLTSDGTHEATPQPPYSSTSATHPHPPPTPTPVPHTPTSGARRLFGKVFRRKDPSSSSSTLPVPSSPSPARSPVLPVSPLPPTGSDGRASKRNSLLLSGAAAHQYAHAYASESLQMPPTPVTAMPTVLGIQPTLRSASPYPPGSAGMGSAPYAAPGAGPGGGAGTAGGGGTRNKRPTSYVWVARKWMKESVVPGTEVLGLVEIRLDWSRGKHARRGREGRESRRTSEGRERRASVRDGRTSEVGREERERRASGGVTSVRSKASLGSAGSSSLRNRAEYRRMRDEVDDERDGDGDEGSERSHSQSPRTSTASASTESHRVPSERDRDRGDRDRDDDDEPDSDPEDSETPWTCHLVVRRLHVPHPHYGYEDPQAQQDVRVKVGAVVPAPHHPKVVALLKVPFPLPDVYLRVRRPLHPVPSPGRPLSSSGPMLTPVGEVEVEARKRIVTPQGVARPAAEFDEIAIGVGPSASISGSGNGGVKGLMSPSVSKRWRHTSSASQPSSASSASPSPSPANLHVDAHGHLSLDGVHTKVEGGLLLSAEEIKDAVCCTALWVVVREAFGGVGRVSRKGDGWRIRG